MHADAKPTNPACPPLQNGDRLSREEFERRYEAMPHVKLAELIEGVVCVASPLSLDHGEPHGDLSIWLGTYKVATPGVRMADNVSLRLDASNEFQPDVSLFIDPAAGGQTRATDRYLSGAPELVAEVAVSSAALDRGDKFRAYQRNGAGEYLLWQPREGKLDWWRWQDGEFVLLEPEHGVLRSRVFPGLWLDPEALLAGDMTQVLTVLQEGVQSEAHRTFVKALQARCP